MQKKLVREYPLLLVIIATTLIIRLAAGYLQSFSNDELSALYRLQFDNFHDLMYWGVRVDGHPALVQLFLYVYQPLVGKNELLIRLPFILASSLSLGYIFFSLKKLSGEFTAYMVVIILAFAGFSIQLGYFARPYALGILFTSMATYYWIKIFIEQQKGNKNLVIFVIVSILACYTHYFALLQIGILGAATFLFSPVKQWWKIMVAGLIVMLAYIPNYNILMFQLSVGGIGGWLGKPKNYFLVDLVLSYFDRNPVIISCFVLFPMLLMIVKPSKPVLKRIGLYLFLSLVPFCLLYFYSIKINSLLQPSACFFFMPFLLAGFFSLFENGEKVRGMFTAGYGICIVFFLGSTLFMNSAFASIHFAEFKRIAKYIEEHESDSVTTVVAVNNPFYIDWYLKDKKPDLYITDMGNDLKFMKRYIDTCKTEEFIYAFTNQRSNGEIPFVIKDQYPVRKAKRWFNNSELYHFEKRGINIRYNDEPGYISRYGFRHLPQMVLAANPLDPFTGKMMMEDGTNWGAFFLDSTIEFSSTLELNLKDLKLRSTDIMVAEAGLFNNETCNIQMVMSVERGNKIIFWRSRQRLDQYRRFKNFARDSTSFNIAVDAGSTHFFGLAEVFNDPDINIETDKIKVYIWNPDRCECFVSRFVVTFYHGNPYSSSYSQ